MAKAKLMALALTLGLISSQAQGSIVDTTISVSTANKVLTESIKESANEYCVEYQEKLKKEEEERKRKAEEKARLEEERRNTVKETFLVTAYCSCGHCSDEWGTNTASGKTACAGRTIAVDPSVIPLGTEVTIGGHTYIAEDTGGKIKGNRIDVYFNSHQEALDFGKQYKTVTYKRK